MVMDMEPEALAMLSLMEMGGTVGEVKAVEDLRVQ